MVQVNVLIEERAQKAVQVISRRAHVVAAYLFGSYVEGRADEWSDIDLALFLEEADSWDIEERARAFAMIRKEVGCDIEPHFFSAESYRNPPKASFAAYILKHGIPVRAPIAGSASAS